MKPTVTKHKDIFGRKITGYTAELCGYESTRCHTPLEALQELDNAIRQSNGSDSRSTLDPTIVSWRSWTYLIHFHPVYGWTTSRIGDPLEPLQTGRVKTGSTGWKDSFDREATIEQCQYQIAMLGFDVSNDTTVPEICPARMVREFESWAEFQRRYLAAKRAGLSDMDCHNYAGKNPARPDLCGLSL